MSEFTKFVADRLRELADAGRVNIFDVEKEYIRAALAEIERQDKMFSDKCAELDAIEDELRLCLDAKDHANAKLARCQREMAELRATMMGVES